MWATSLGILRPFTSVLIFLNLEKTFLLSSCCSNHQAKKYGSAGLDKLRNITLRHFWSQHMHRFIYFLTRQWHEVHLDLKKILIMSFTMAITCSSRRLITIFLTPVLEVCWITHQVLSILWLNLGALWHWHHQAETTKI